ncbi:unnamed protein product, partial [Notodromas monacha]
SRDPTTNEHIPYAENRNLTGTARYASINTHLGIERSRRDDLESLAYIVIYFLRGSLPWQGIKGSVKKEKYRRIGEKKVSIPIEDLVRGYPSELTKFLRYVRSLRFEQNPNYSYLASLIKSAIAKVGPTPTHFGDASSSSTQQQQQHQRRTDTASVSENTSTTTTTSPLEVFDWNVRALELCEKGRVDATRRSPYPKWRSRTDHDHNHNHQQQQPPWYGYAKRSMNAGALRDKTKSQSYRSPTIFQQHTKLVQFTYGREEETYTRQLQSFAASKRKDLVLQGKYPQDPVNQSAQNVAVAF